MIEFTIYGNPATKKNSSQIVNVRGRAMLIPSKKYKEYEKHCLMTIPFEHRIGIDYGVNVKAIYYRDSHRRVDISNLHSALHDILVKANVLADDNANIICSTDGSRVRYDKENPRTEVIIDEYKEDS